jgi:hypothetical protein
VPTIVNSIPKWSEPRSGKTCQSSIRLAKELVASVRSRTLSLPKLGLKKVPVPGVFRRASSYCSSHPTSLSAPIEGLARGSHQGWWVLKSPANIELGLIDLE